ITPNMPDKSPKVFWCEKIYHPSINLKRKVCFNILHEDRKPVLNLNAVIVALKFLFIKSNASDSLNKEAADNLR
ncbi:ubiquitin-conjugating enzyme/RWD-like protein, partial [Phialemonium atrogriseum]